MTDTTTTAPPTAFCQNCGTPLTSATTRTVGAAVYCEPCLDARLHGAPHPPAAPYSAGPSIPNPGLAALLGLIPGVGAMYNEQYAKGIVHLIVFAVLVVFASDVNGIFGLFIAGWECYMVIEAHHTARARRDHTPLPNPFGLNDIGERLGFGKAWPTGAPNVASVFHDAATAAAHDAQQFHAHQHPGANPFYTPPTQTPPAEPMPNHPPFQDPVPPPHSAFGDWSHSTHEYAQNPAAGTQQPWRETFNSVPPVSQPFVTPPTPPMPPITGASRFPAGAVWLIAAGVFFLLATTGIFNFFRGDIVVGLGLLALAVWLFLRRMLDSGPTLTSDGSPAYGLRAVRALRASAWVGLTGVLFLFNAIHLLGWNHSWPLYIILAGVMGFLERAAQHNAALYTRPPS